MIYRLLILFLALSLFVAAPVYADQQEFSDVPPGHWAYHVIHDLADQGLLAGYFDGTFRPDNTVSRAEFAAMLVRFADLPTNSGYETIFRDVIDSHWALPFIEAAKSYFPGHQSQGGAVFEPAQPARREDVVAATARALNNNIVAGPEILQERFADYPKINSALLQPISWAVRQGLVSGYPDGTFRPGSHLTRAEAAAFLHRSFVLDTSISTLLSTGEIRPLRSSDPAFKELAERLERERGSIAFRANPVWEPDFFVRTLSLYGGKGPEVLYIHIKLHNDYFQWQGQWQPEAVKRYVEQTALDASALSGGKKVLVMLGHSFEVDNLSEPERVFDRKYLSRTGSVWNVDRFYAGAMAVNRAIMETWVADN